MDVCGFPEALAFTPTVLFSSYVVFRLSLVTLDCSSFQLMDETLYIISRIFIRRLVPWISEECRQAVVKCRRGLARHHSHKTDF